MERNILGNLGKLPNDVILYMMRNLSDKDVEKLCRSNKDFHTFCKKFQVMNKRAIEELKRLAPLITVNDLIDTPEKQVKAIQRGQVTPYVAYIHEHGKYLNIRVTMGLHKGSDNDIIFSIRGPPPPEGTKVWLAGLFEDVPEAEEETYLDVYLDQGSALHDLLERHPHWFEGNLLQEDAETLEEKIFILKETGKNWYGYVTIILKEVTLP